MCNKPFEDDVDETLPHHLSFANRDGDATDLFPIAECNAKLSALRVPEESCLWDFENFVPVFKMIFVSNL